MTARHRPRVLLAAIAATTLVGACGAEDSTGSQPTPTAASGRLRPPVAVDAVGSSAGDGGDAGALAAESAAPTDLAAMPAYVGFTYEVGDGLPALPDAATGYQYQPSADVDEATVAALAGALGVTAAPVRVDDATTGLLWRAGPDDGAAPSLGVSRDPQLTWYYSGAWANEAIPVACAEVEAVVESDVVAPADTSAPTNVVGSDAVGAGSDPCAAPEPPAGVPTAAEAEARVNDVLAAIAEDPAAYELDTYADEWSASVVASPSLDGVRSPVSWGFGFGAEGALQWANGSLADPVPAGPYPLVDLDAAIARLTEQGSSAILARGGPLVDVGAPDVAVASPAPPAPPATTVIEPEVATLVDVRADFWWAWDADGSVWLLPAYTFTDTEDRLHTVAAVTDEYLVVADPLTTAVPPEPKPLSSEPGQTSTASTPTEPLDPPIVDPALLVGLTVDDAAEVLAERGLTLRVVREDDVDLPVTADFSETRVNVAVESGTVTAVVSLG